MERSGQRLGHQRPIRGHQNWTQRSLSSILIEENVLKTGPLSSNFLKAYPAFMAIVIVHNAFVLDYIYYEVPNKRRRRLLIFVFFSRVDGLIPLSTIIEFHQDKFQDSITFQQK